MNEVPMGNAYLVTKDGRPFAYVPNQAHAETLIAAMEWSYPQCTWVWKFSIAWVPNLTF